MTDNRQLFIDIGVALAADCEAAVDLHTWLPSYHAAKIAHGDHASERMPPPYEVMCEASHVIAYLTRKSEIPPQYFHCPCGDCGTITTLREWRRDVKGSWRNTKPKKGKRCPRP